MPECNEVDPDGNGKVPLFDPLPEIDGIYSKESKLSVTDAMRYDTVEAYAQIRSWLYANFRWKYFDADHQKIKDEVLMAIILAGEVGASLDAAVYNETVEALGNQYYDEDFIGDSYCDSKGCTIEQQISWLYGMEFVRNDVQRKASLNRFQTQLPYAKQAATGYSSGVDDSWFWGNVSDAELASYSVVIKQETNTYPGKPFFIVYRRR